MGAAASFPWVVDEEAEVDWTYRVWREAVASGKDEIAAQARADLLAWLDLGLEPRWTNSQRIAFYLVLP